MSKEVVDMRETCAGSNCNDIECDNVIKCNHDIDSDYLMFNLDYNSKNMKTCLEVVRNYIIEHNLLIVGGMSIDFALRLKGEFLYSDYQIPDYDVIDPENIKHANSIASTLCAMGMKNISIVPAVHKTTVRVQLMGYTVFDSTFVPQYMYDKIPYMMYGDYKFIDPVYQKIDQYTSLALLWNVTGPTFNVINRFEKDIKRKDLLNNHYKFDYKPDDRNNMESTISKKTINMNLDTIVSQKAKNLLEFEGTYSLDLDFILHGKLAYCMLYNEFKKIVAENGLVVRNDIIECNYSIKNDIISFDYYGEGVELINYGDGVEEKKIFNSLMSEYEVNKFVKSKKSAVSTSMPSRTIYKSEDETVTAMDMTGNMLSINSVKTEKGDVFISNYNYLLAYFLFSYYFCEEKQKQYYAQYYLSTLEIINIVQEQTTIKNVIDNCFFYSLNTLGVKYWMDENLLFYMQNYDSVKETRKGLSTVPPKNYISNPDCEIKKHFSEEDKKKSTFYFDSIVEVSETNFLKELEEIL